MGWQPGAPALTVLRGAPMVGPFRSALAACQAAPPCGSTELDEQTGRASKPPAKPDCSAVKSKEDPNLNRDKYLDLTWRAKGDVAFAPVQCAVPEMVRSVEATYFFYAKRSDGWWRNEKPLLAISYNDKYCTQQVNGAFRTKGERTTLRFQAGENCVGCSKESSVDETLDVLLVADVPDAPAPPVVYPTLVTGQHFKVDATDVTNADPADPECKASKKSVVLNESWPDADTLTLTGAATWRSVQLDADGLQFGTGATRSPSTAGTYTFTR